MERFFNTAGPIRQDLHYYVPPLERFNMTEMESLIQQQKYFVLHAPRQVGKTSYLLALRDYLNQTGQYHATYFNVEVGQYAWDNVEQAMRAILTELSTYVQYEADFPITNDEWQALIKQSGADNALNPLLTLWAQRSTKPLVLLIDEVDALVGDSLIALLRQLRAGYTKRPTHFPQSIILCGVRDVRDYRIRSSRDKAIITGGSAFNVKAESLRMGNFSRAEMERLLLQHTETTGQVFVEGVFDLMWALTEGQPWLVNALAYEVTFRIKAGRDRQQPITSESINQAKENLIQRRETHLDQLIDKLQEGRVRQVIEPILATNAEPDLISTDDILYVEDLGLIKRDNPIRIANLMYQEVIPRELTYSTQRTIVHEPAWYIDGAGRLDMEKLLTAFQQFFREHSEHWVERFSYKEAGPQLLLQAFLQRIVNGGGRIEREYGLGLKRTDLLIIWPVDGQVQRVVLELKILRGNLETTMTEGLQQTWAYMDRCDTTDSHLVIFDRSDKPWQDKIFRQVKQHQGQPITVWGM